MVSKLEKAERPIFHHILLLEIMKDKHSQTKSFTTTKFHLFAKCKIVSLRAGDTTRW